MKNGRHIISQGLGSFLHPFSPSKSILTQDELNRSSKRLAARNTTPGPDGIPGRVWMCALVKVWWFDWASFLPAASIIAYSLSAWKKAGWYSSKKLEVLQNIARHSNRYIRWMRLGDFLKESSPAMSTSTSQVLKDKKVQLHPNPQNR